MVVALHRTARIVGIQLSGNFVVVAAIERVEVPSA